MRKFNGSRICGDTPQPCAAYPDVSSAGQFYSVGPPYVWHSADVGLLADAWWDAMEPAYSEEGTHDIQLDMYAYGLAAAASGVAHVQLAHYMVSSPDDAASEAWKFVDALPSMSCRAPTYPPGALLQTVVHACQHYKACSDGRPLAADGSCGGASLFNFHKGHVPGDIMSCDAPGLMVRARAPVAHPPPAGRNRVGRDAPPFPSRMTEDDASRFARHATPSRLLLEARAGPSYARFLVSRVSRPLVGCANAPRRWLPPRPLTAARQVPPDDLFDVQTTSHGRRAAFMVCQLTALINRAAHAYKRQNCPATWQEPSGCTRLSLTGSTNLPTSQCPAGFGGGRLVESARTQQGQRKAAGTLMSLLALTEGVRGIGRGEVS